MASTASSEISNVNIDNIIIPQNSGLRSVAPPPEFQNGFGTNQANVALPDFRIFTDQTVDRRVKGYFVINTCILMKKR